MSIDENDLIFKIGESVGRYRVDALIGIGGMGQVYRAYHIDLEREFALKAIRKDFISSPEEIERFRREARTAHRLQHPNIVGIDDFNLHREICYLRMPLMSGREVNGSCAVSLSDLIRLRDEPMVAEEIRPVLCDIFRGLGYAHSSGVIHRDLKPSNILFEGDQARVSDFGLVRIVGEEFLQKRIRLSVKESQIIIRGANTSSFKASGSSDTALIGTYEFMAPETKDGVEADERSDIYAVGLIALYMFTGRSTIGVGMPSANHKRIPKEWDFFFEKCLSTDPESRFQDASEALEWLESKDSGSGRIRKRRTKKRIKQPKAARKRGRRFISLLVLLGLLGGGWYAVGSDTTRARKVVEEWGLHRYVEYARSLFASNPEPPAWESDPSVTAEPTAPSVLPEPAVEVWRDPTPPALPALVETPPPVLPSPDPVLRVFAPPETPVGTSVPTSPPRDQNILQIPLPGAPDLVLLRVSPGSFLFGSPPGEPGRMAQHEPEARMETIPASFFMGKHEVSQAQFRALLSVSGQRDPSRHPGDNRPANNMTMAQIELFLRELNHLLRRLDRGQYRARLPTVIEWEYVARAGHPGRFAGLGSVNESGAGMAAYAHFDSISGPLPVGSKKANLWGFFDMYGNVREVTASGNLKGGGFDSKLIELRSSAVIPSFSPGPNTGFRVLIEER